MIIVSDSSPLICFTLLNKLYILDHLIDELYVPFAVFQEITQPNKPYSQELNRFAENRVMYVKNEQAVQLLLTDLDRGESEAIVLAIENKINAILIDEYKGRKIAESHGLSPIGTIGVLIKAKRMGLINVVRPELDILIANHQRISQDLYHKALELSGETK